MNRATALLLLPLAWVFVLPPAAMAQADVRANASAVDANIASAASGGSDDRVFQQAADAERRRIAEGRAAANVRYGQDKYACWQRFAVNACLDRALERRRAALDVLRHDELALNAQQRERRTAARLDEIARKQPASARQNPDRNAQPPAMPASGAP